MVTDKPEVDSIRVWLKCPECTYVNFHYRSKSKDYICHHCGAVFTADYKHGTTRLKQCSIFGPKKKG